MAVIEGSADSAEIIVSNSNSFSEGKRKPNHADADIRLALGVLLSSGMAALGHEILWTRRLIDLLGASTESSARVFECFFLGLCLGAAVASILLPRIKRHWHVLGAIELGVAVLSIPALLLPEWTAWVWPSLGPERLVGWQGSVLKTVFSMLIILPPTILMGMTLPVLISTVIKPSNDRTRKELVLYAANTLGGVLGLGLVVLVSIFPAVWKIRNNKKGKLDPV